jgi:tetratricopeptide (TPR) repeat protein
MKAVSPTAGGLLIFFSLLLSSCAGPSQRVDFSAVDLPRQKEIAATPFFPQERYQCGPAALATVLVHSNAQTSPKQLVSQVYIPGRKGSLQTEMIATARRYNRVAYVLDPNLLNLLREVGDGKPVLVMQNLGLKILPKWHYAVVVGYNLDTSKVILRSGVNQRKIVSFKLFDRTWRRSGRWAVVVTAADEVPKTANEKNYLMAILPFERNKQWQTAKQAYRTASKKWPGSLGAHMGLGNTFYHLAQLGKAEQSYRKALLLDHDHAPAHNNLAQVLLETNRFDKAKQHALQAVRLGGPHVDVYAKTLAEIEKRVRGN